MENIPELIKSQFNKEKWLPLAEETPFLISSNCCDVMKKKPFNRFSRESHRKSIQGMLADESRLRQQKWLKQGCNAFDAKKPSSNPMMFWTEQDVLEYIKLRHLPIAECYGDIVYGNDDGQLAINPCRKCKYQTTGLSRTGW